MQTKPTKSDYVSVFLVMLAVHFLLYFGAMQFLINSMYADHPDLLPKVKNFICGVLVILSMACSYIVNNKNTQSNDEKI